ncbi:MAG: serine/threonine-protein kinase [Candidatus Melainabacteria bacterium]|nr:serine/threonine-protein kinase [Candidatus Melainabacteria bacterium]
MKNLESEDDKESENVHNDGDLTRPSIGLQQPFAESENFELRAGDMVGDYEVLSLIGTGGMGYVYEARHRVLNKVYALKTIRADCMNETSWRRMQVEAQAIARMNHPNIVGIHNFGMHDGRPFYVMDLLKGTSLAEKLQKGPLPLEQALQIFIEVCCGLTYAHKKGIIHRDIKPGNIILLKSEDASGAKVKIVDFGIAKLAGASDPNNQNLTSAGEIFGSPLYMSPEQCLSERTDARSDIYALGCTLFEALTGHPPFRGKNQVQTMMLHQGEPAPTLAEKAAKLSFPEALEQVLAKMLAKKPMERYQNLATVAEELEKISASLSSSEETPITSQIKKNIALAVVAIAICSLIVTSVAFLAISGTSAIPGLTKLFVGQKDLSTSKVESKSSEETATNIKREKAPPSILLGPVCTYERRNKKLFKVFNFPKVVFGTIYCQDGGRKSWLASGRKEYPADAELIFSCHSKMMTHIENFKALRNGDFSSIHLRYLAEGQPPKSDALLPTPEAQFSDLSGALRQMSHLDKLGSLSLADCSQLKDDDIKLLNQFPYLTSLDLSNTNAKGGKVAKLTGLKKIRNLDFSACRQISPLLRALSGSKELVWLKASELTDGALSKDDLNNIATLSNLEKLEVNGVGIDNDGIEILSRLPRLKELSAKMGAIDRRAIKSLKKMKALKLAELRNPLWSQSCEEELQTALQR